MKKIILFTILIFACMACKHEEEPMIDYSNIEDLYYQPLPIIQQCISGKWNWYASFGGFIGVSYPDSTYVEFTDSYYVITTPNDTSSLYFSWRKLTPPALYGIHDEETYVLCDKEMEGAIWYFNAIKNDTLSIYLYGMADHYEFVRIKSN
jgi:hypothetical protein